MINNSFNLRKFLITTSPLSTTILFIIIDSVPFYLLEDFSVNTQLSFIIAYLWICLNPESIRPLFLLILGLLIDILNDFHFGFTTFFLSLILFIQKKDNTLMNSVDFRITYIRFSVFIILVNIFSSILEILSEIDMIFNTKNFIIINLVSLIAFPFLFLIVRYYNKRLKIYVE